MPFNFGGGIVGTFLTLVAFIVVVVVIVWALKEILPVLLAPFT